MSRRSLARFVAFAATLSMFGASATFAPASAADQVIKIGVDLPVSGADASDGIPTQNGAALAIEEANAHAPNGFHFEMDALDDAVGGVHNPQQGATNIRSLAADPAVMGVVGPFNSNVAAQVIVAAIEKAIKDNGGKMPTRAQVLKNVQSTSNFKSIIGTFGFDKNGDTTSPVISLWKVSSGKQDFVKQANVAAK